jgi:hypothetical protein
MSPCFATAIPTVVVILPLSLAEAFSGFGCLCDNQNQAPTDTRTRNAKPPIQRISFRPRPDFGGCCAISNTTSSSLASRARRQLTSSPLVFLLSCERRKDVRNRHRVSICFLFLLWSKTGLHPRFGHEIFSMRKQIKLALCPVALVLMACFASCQSGRTSTAKVNDTDANAVFAQGGAQASSSPGSSSGRSSRRGRGNAGAPDAGSGSQ